MVVSGQQVNERSRNGCTHTKHIFIALMCLGRLKSCNENGDLGGGTEKNLQTAREKGERERKREKISGLLFPFPGHDMINRFLLI